MGPTPGFAAGESIDRVAPTRRPAGQTVGTQKWRDLLFIHWRCEADAIQRLLPPALQLDRYEGDAFVGLVPFAMQDVRPRWLPRRLAFHFLETNVRTYVTHRGEPGVYFFSLDASSWLAVQAARWGWSLPYYHARMHMSRDATGVEYASQRRGTRHGEPADLRVRYQVRDKLGPSPPGSLEHFLLERYLLFTMRRGRLLRGQVHHAPYPAQLARLDDLETTLLDVAGLPSPQATPSHVHYAPGVDVDIYPLVSVSAIGGGVAT